MFISLNDRVDAILSVCDFLGGQSPFLQIILLNFRQELAILADDGHNNRGADDCSDVMIRFGETSDLTAYLGHNEDNSADTVNTTYFVQAKLVRLPCISTSTLACMPLSCNFDASCVTCSMRAL